MWLREASILVEAVTTILSIKNDVLYITCTANVFAMFGMFSLQAGDVVECEIDEIGTITNKIVAS